MRGTPSTCTSFLECRSRNNPCTKKKKKSEKPKESLFQDQKKPKISEISEIPYRPFRFLYFLLQGPQFVGLGLLDLMLELQDGELFFFFFDFFLYLLEPEFAGLRGGQMRKNFRQFRKFRISEFFFLKYSIVGFTIQVVSKETSVQRRMEKEEDGGGGRKREQGRGNREEGTGKREQGRGNREQGTGNREQGTGNREQGTGNREQGTGKREEEGEDIQSLLLSQEQWLQFRAARLSALTRRWPKVGCRVEL
jgi:hypothetical protein